METIKLSVRKRDPKTKAKKLRAEKLVPGVLYGRGVEAVNLAVPYLEFARTLKAAGESTLVDAELEGGKTVKVLIKDYQADPLSGEYVHFDLYQVDLTKKLRVDIVLNFVGEAPAVKELGGSLIKSIDRLSVECLPSDLVHSIDVDVTGLKTFEDKIHVKDILPPKGLHVLDNPDAVVATAEAPMTEEQFKKLEEAGAATDVAAIKTEGEVKKSEEEAKKAEEAKTAE